MIEIPTRGDYCSFTDYEGKRIGRVISVKDNLFLIKYYYDAFTGYVTTTRKQTEIEYVPKSRGMRIPLDNENEDKQKVIKKKPDAEISDGYLDNEGRESTLLLKYSCPTCHKVIKENQQACEECGTFFDWKMKAYIKMVPTIMWR